MAPHSSTLAWKIPWTEEPGGLQSMESLRVGHDWATSLSLFTVMHWRRKWQPTPVFLPGESPGTGEPGALPSMGSHRVGHDWSDLAAAAAARCRPLIVFNILSHFVKSPNIRMQPLSQVSVSSCLRISLYCYCLETIAVIYLLLLLLLLNIK